MRALWCFVATAVCERRTRRGQTGLDKTPYAGITRIRFQGDPELQFAPISAEEALSAPVFMSVA